MGDITIKITEVEKGKYYIESSYENDYLFNAEGSPDELFFLYLYFLDKENQIDIEPIIIIGSFKLFLNSLKTELSETLKRAIKKRAFQQLFNVLGESKIIEL